MFRRVLTGGESGSAVVYFGILMPVILLLLGVVIEGGYVEARYRRMQAAADMAALVGAQALPCSVNGDNNDCIENAETRACDYALANGFSGCVGGATSGSRANVPPLSCSPYDTVNYGNEGTNQNCKSASASPSYYNYIEVKLTQSLGVPIFNSLITLSVHAVARHGQVSPSRFAIEVLDPTQSRALTLSGSKGGGLITVGPIVSNSTASDSIYNGGQSTQVACSGQWYTAANETLPPSGPAAGVNSNTGGTAAFAPPSCSSGAVDSPPRFLTNFPPVPDPYSASSVPTGNMSGCTPCGSLGEVYTWTSNRSSGTWLAADNLPTMGSGSNYELFPGVYPKGISITGGNEYFNPGVYTLQGDMKATGGNACIYGAPACDHAVNSVNSNANCSDVSFHSGDTAYVAPGAWYYYCSPWGMWDATALPNRPVTTSAPTFTDGTPLNGITFYLQSGNISLNGNGSSYLAFPNPCPGTDTWSSGSVSFPSGSDSGAYTYPTGSLAKTDGVATSPAGQIYPNADLSFSAECAEVRPPSPRNVWTGELPGQHLHFLIFARSASSSITLNGNGLQNWWGIIYNPATAGCGTSCTISLNGSGGSGNGPPLLVGQVIADNASFSGNSNFEIYYSPCRPDGDVCSVGYGTSLVE
jgi:Flp pilus assembly protein TadG